MRREATLAQTKVLACFSLKIYSTLKALLPYAAARLLSVSRQVRAHMWDSNPKLVTLPCLEV